MGTTMRLGATLGLACFLVACGGGGVGGDDGGTGPIPTVPTGSISGSVDFRGGFPGFVLDQEPNDAVDQAQDAGEVPIGGRLTLVGDVDETDDPTDGYRLRLSHIARMRLSLKLNDPSSEIEVSVFEPISMQHVATAESGTDGLDLRTFARGTVHVVVRARSGASRYELNLAVDSSASPHGEIEPNALGQDAAYFGRLDVGNSFEILGTANADDDRSDAFLFVLPAAATIETHLETPAFADFQVRLYDATADLMAPVPISTKNIGAGTLLAVEVHAVDGSGPWRLGVTVVGSSVVLQSRRAARFAEENAEARRLGLRDPERRYGEPIGAFRDGEVIVRYRTEEGVRLERMAVGRPPDDVGPTACRRFTMARAAALEAQDDVLWAEPNGVVQPFLDTDDTYRRYQWHYDMIQMRSAWNLSTGDDDVIVAVIDTGRTNHPDLQSRQIAGYDMISLASISGDGGGYDNDPTDVGDGVFGGNSTWHGTHVAGTIGAVTNNDLGVSGVTWSTRIMHVRALGLGGGTTEDLANAVLFAAGLDNASGVLPLEAAHVINMSLGGGDFSQAVRDACDAAQAAGVVLIAAAGNDSSGSTAYPAGYPSVISVGAVDATRGLAPYSNFGSWIDLVAPGGDLYSDANGDGYGDGILSTLWDDSVSPPQAVYQFYQGTSMAAPHVAGVAALMLAMDPELSPSQVQAILELTAEDLGTPGEDTIYGHGLLNAYSALLQVEGEVPQGPPTLLLSPDFLNFGTSRVQLTVAVKNGGGGFLDVQGVTPSTENGIDWLDAELLPVQEDRRSHGGIRVTVNRAALLAGAYVGHLNVTSASGPGTVTVAVAIGASVPPPPNLEIYVLAVDAETGEEMGRTTVNPAGSLSFRFPTLPTGDYLFYAGTDFDQDGELGEPGEYFGAWPFTTAPEPVHLISREVIENVDFPVDFTSALGS